ncbi:MAG: site-specific DNA-methyltransferase [Syntrophorhabdus aromaticivorans]|uniref:site-specific DNA-methyltransferase (adenine-specific) n=1 Tax=Syntrophorhabdus aromaticivorans TaxID=328301 RepID=A0A971M2Q3_9BACT|nr:site-specific DNA-methyltransferase [Syntrophorhabdus aromaticivorans]
MPTTEQLRSRLLRKLKELFQLDQPDLDFGFYRIMHAKAQQVSEFIEKDLLKIVEDAFGEVDQIQKTTLQAKIDDAIETARKFGAPDPEQTDAAREARARYKAVEGSTAAEADIYDHLYRFFERYYDDGDFVSRRYYTRETEARSAPFAVPYNGEEVKLHWANADQYYIKTTEYFSNFTFDLSSAARVQIQKNTKEKVPEMGDLFGDADGNVPDGFRVHFRIVEATEGEHGNVKASDVTKRYFIIHKEKPVEVNDAGEMVINFEYRPDPEKSGQEGTWRDKRNAEAVATILTSVKTMADSKANLATYLRLFIIPAPTESDKKRPLLAKYVNQYTARNTMDYFIHKDLGGFLRRELDFYIKNEMMRLDDIENAEAPAVESYLAKIKVFRKIAGKLIDFLAQLENFQKKLWLKKKFVVETNYCVTLDRIPEELYPEIAANEAQREEWVRLFAIDETRGDLGTPGYSAPLTTAFLKAHNKLVVDTKFFDDDFKASLIASIQDFDEQCDGLLVHGESFQTLYLVRERFRDKVKTIYIDPPYNTSASEIAYKNNYKHSSWLCMVNNSLHLAKRLLRSSDGVICCTIDDFEQRMFSQVIELHFGEVAGTVAIRIKPSGRPIPNGFAISHEYAIFAKINQFYPIARLGHSEEQKLRYRETDEHGRFFWEMFRKAGSNSNRENRPTMFYPFYLNTNNGKLRLPGMEFDTAKQRYLIKEPIGEDEMEIYPIKDDGTDGCWYFGLNRALRIIDEFKAVPQENGEYRVYYRRRPNEGVQPTTLWFESKYSATEHGTALLKAIFGEQETFSYPKSIHAVRDCLAVTGICNTPEGSVLDYLAGSGTTGHAVISLNREDGGKRKYILVEMGGYFDTVLKPRIAKVVYSETWKDGKPTACETGISHCFKYLRLESYEDTLNNLRFDDNPTRHKAMASTPSLKEDFMLHYLLDVETKGSQSLLNIDAFSDPTAYTLKVKKPGSDEYVNRNVDLLETFNYLIGLRVVHIAEPQVFNAIFARITDPELPEDQHTKLVIDGKMRKVNDQLLMTSEQIQPEEDPDHCSLSIDHCSWWFRKVEGWVPKNRENSNNGQKEKVLIVWRKLTGDPEKDNLMLDEWFEKNRISTRDFEFDTIYVNGSNNLPNLQKEGDTWKVRLIEEEFMKRMWDIEEV